MWALMRTQMFELIWCGQVIETPANKWASNQKPGIGRETLGMPLALNPHHVRERRSHEPVRKVAAVSFGQFTQIIAGIGQPGQGTPCL